MFRSMLFLPGNTPKMLINANYFGADAVIFDLEDAVSPAEKDAARILVANILRDLDFCRCTKIVRINAIDTDDWKLDLDRILPRQPDLIMLPKASQPQDVLLLDEYLLAAERHSGRSPGIIALIETALGIENAYLIASASERVRALFLGAEDLAATLRCKRTKSGQEIAYARQRLVNAARAAGIDVYDTPFTDVNDDAGLSEDTAYAKSLGFTGKAAISPRQLQIINRVFSPSPDEIQYAQEVMEAIALAKEQGRGVVALRGRMIDAPVAAQAQQVLDAANRQGIKTEVLV